MWDAGAVALLHTAAGAYIVLPAYIVQMGCLSYPPCPAEFLELLEHDKRKPKHTGFFISKVGQLVLVGRLMGALLSKLARQAIQRGRSGWGRHWPVGMPLVAADLSSSCSMALLMLR